MKHILILNGSPRKNGSTAGLVKAFTEGAESAGNTVEELYLYGLDINDCVGCLSCEERGENDRKNPCSQEDDMTVVYEAFRKSDVVVLASPVYTWMVTGKLKLVIDRMYAMNNALGREAYHRSVVLLCTAAGRDYSPVTLWFRNFERVLGWEILGSVLGIGKTEEARELGASIS